MSPLEMKVWLGVAAVVWVAGWLVWSRFWPYADCRKCKGRGQFRSPTGRSYRRCPRCKGTGARLMLGRKIWNKLLAVKKDATG